VEYRREKKIEGILMPKMMKMNSSSIFYLFAAILQPEFPKIPRKKVFAQDSL